MCQNLNNVSSSVTEKMKSLFPSTSSGGIKRSTDFDPTRESDVMVNKRRKKKAVRIKPVTLKVAVVGRFASSIPRGKHKNKHKAERKEQTVMITRAMTSLEVKNAISNVFQHLEISDYEILQSDRGGRLTLAKDQLPDGATLAEGIIKRKAVLYIRPKSVEVRFANVFSVSVYFNSVQADEHVS